MLESDGISGWSVPNPGFTKMESEVQQREDMRAQWEPELDPKASQRPLLFGGRVMLARGEFVSLVTRKAKTGLATGPVGAAVCAPCPQRRWDVFPGAFRAGQSAENLRPRQAAPRPWVIHLDPSSSALLLPQIQDQGRSVGSIPGSLS